MELKIKSEIKVTDKKVIVIGDGGWGTTLGILLHKNGFQVKIWSKFEDNVQSVIKTGFNSKFLPEIPIPKEVGFICDNEGLFDEVDFCVMAVPAAYLRSVCQDMKDIFPNDIPIVSVTKGIENGSLLRMSEIIAEVLPASNIVVLSGPSHAEEVARDIPTTVVVAAQDKELAQIIQNYFTTKTFRVYTSEDVLGLELGGALKNVIAIAAGICDGLGFGANTKAALITRGLVEISRLGCSMGANDKTFAGLSGMGDLITTCVSGFGRNRNLGEALAKGRTLKEVLEHTCTVAEGVYTAKSVNQLSKKMDIEMPISNAVYQILYENKPVKAAVSDLLERDPKPEHH